MAKQIKNDWVFSANQVQAGSIGGIPILQGPAANSTKLDYNSKGSGVGRPGNQASRKPKKGRKKRG